VSDTVVVFTGAARVDVPDGATIVAADGGAEAAVARGLQVDVLVGDLDSISDETLAAVEASGARIERHPRAKDATDLELALDAAVALGARRVLVAGSDGGRLDHLLGGLLLLGRYPGIELDAVLGETRVHVVRGERTLDGAVGETISLFALNGPAHGVETDGLEYPLRGETLEPGTSRGVSNVFAAERVRVVVKDGVVLALRT
jgi:thiamine pyrophosphokinase